MAGCWLAALLSRLFAEHFCVVEPIKVGFKLLALFLRSVWYILLCPNVVVEARKVTSIFLVSFASRDLDEALPQATVVLALRLVEAHHLLL